MFQSANDLRPNSPVRIAGVNVGTVKKIEAQTRLERRGRHDGDQRPGPADQRRRHGQDPAAHLPRGQLLRRPQARHAGRAELDDGGTIKVTQTATPVQLDQVLTSLQCDTRQDLRDLLDGLAVALQREPTAAEDRHADPSTRGETGAQAFNDAYDDAGPAAKAQAMSTRRCSAPSPTRTSPPDQRPRPHGGRSRPQRAPAAGPRHQLQPDGGRARFRAGQPERSIRALAPTLETANARVRLAQRARSRPRARSRARSFPACARRRRPSTRRSRGSSRPAGCSSPGRAAGPGARARAGCARPRATLTNQSIELLPQTDLVSHVRRVVSCPRATSSSRTSSPTGPRELQGVLLRDGRPRRRGPELRRQRHVRALPDRRRRQQVSLGTVEHRRRRRSSAPADAAARQPPGVPGKQPPHVATRPATSSSCRTSTGPPAARTAPPERRRADALAAAADAAREAAPFGSRSDRE